MREGTIGQSAQEMPETRTQAYDYLLSFVLFFDLLMIIVRKESIDHTRKGNHSCNHCACDCKTVHLHVTASRASSFLSFRFSLPMIRALTTGSRCSSRLIRASTDWMNAIMCTSDVIIYGAGEGSRTHNLRITNPLLCQLSYASKSYEKHFTSKQGLQLGLPHTCEAST